MTESPCPFCGIDKLRIRAENSGAVALLDAFPITEGHTLIVPRRHVVSLFHLEDDELLDVWKLIEIVRKRLVAESTAGAFNIGINEGTAAGQTMHHAHVHVIPRRMGDAQDPRGGIRWIIPGKAAYWLEPK